MNRRRVLVFMTAAVGLSGFALAMKPFIESMNPTDRAVANLPHIDISNIEPGGYRYVSTGRDWGFESEWLIIRDTEGEIYVYTIPLQDGKYLMPDLSWFRPGGFCVEFGPEMISEVVTKDSVIKCHDIEMYDWGRKEWRWTLDGKNLGEHTNDMYSPKFSVNNDKLIIGKK